MKREKPEVHTNTVVGSCCIFKRGMKGVYQHCGKQHLHSYAAEFDFRYNNRIANDIDDTMRAQAILRGAEGKRLTYRRTDSGVVGVPRFGCGALGRLAFVRLTLE